MAVAATSHKAIHNLLDEVIVAGRGGPSRHPRAEEVFRSDESAYDGEGFENTNDNAECAASPRRRSSPARRGCSRGTRWQGKFDYLFIDEAGQVSLADAVAMSPCATQPGSAWRPAAAAPRDAGRSSRRRWACRCSSICSQDEATVSPDRGLFLEQTWRMHPGRVRVHFRRSPTTAACGPQAGLRTPADRVRRFGRDRAALPPGDAHWQRAAVGGGSRGHRGRSPAAPGDRHVDRSRLASAAA